MHTVEKYEQKYGPQTAKFAFFKSIWGHILSRCLFIFLPCMWGVGVTSVFLNEKRTEDTKENWKREKDDCEEEGRM